MTLQETSLLFTLQKLIPLSGRKIIVGVDRLDLIKGIPHKLKVFLCDFVVFLLIKAWERFLQKNESKWVGKAVLVQVSVPSQTSGHGIKTYILRLQKKSSIF